MYREIEYAWIILDIVTAWPGMSGTQILNTEGNVKYLEGEKSAGPWAFQCAPVLIEEHGICSQASSDANTSFLVLRGDT